MEKSSPQSLKSFTVSKEAFQGEVGFDYWWRWQVPICALIIIIPAVACLVLNKRKLKEGRSLSHGCLWVPCWRRLDPKWLLLYRVLAFLYMGWILYRMIAFAGFFVFYFYTQWTFTLVMVYFAIAVITSAQGCWFYTENASFKGKEPAGFWGHVTHTAYQVSAAASILTDMVFWCVLVPMLSGIEFQLTTVIVMIHSVNLVFLIIDSSLNNLSFEWSGFAYFLWWSLIYGAFQWGLHAYGGFKRWPYPFLELASPWAPLCYLGMALLHFLSYGIYTIFTREMISRFSRLFPESYIRLYDETPHHEKTM